MRVFRYNVRRASFALTMPLALLVGMAVSTLPADVISVVDAAGRNVRIERPVRRVVNARSLTSLDLLAVLGEDFGLHIVGWDHSLQKNFRDLYDRIVARFPEVASAADLGEFHRGGLDSERLLALRPDLVVIPAIYLKTHSRHCRAIEQTGLNVLYIYRDNPLTSSLKNMNLLGRVFDCEDRTKAVRAFVEREQQLAFDALARVTNATPRVYVEVASRGPRGYGNTYESASGNDTAWGALLSAARARSIADGCITHMSPLAPDAVLVSDPDAIVFAGSEGWKAPGALWLGYNVSEADVRARLVAYCGRAGWDQLRAVRNGRVGAVHMRFCNEILSFAGLQALIRILHPEAGASLHPDRALSEFHRRFFPWPHSGVWFRTDPL